jgi:hypothetical protein
MNLKMDDNTKVVGVIALFVFAFCFMLYSNSNAISFTVPELVVPEHASDVIQRDAIVAWERVATRSIEMVEWVKANQ